VLEQDDFLGQPPIVMSKASLEGQPFGAYTLDMALGHGGMGSVWLAHRSDGRFEGQAAVKLLSPTLVGHPTERRFAREGSVLARLQHPNISRLLDAGVSSGSQPYLILEYVPGEHIDRYCERQKLDVRQRIRLFLDVLAAVAHAHSCLLQKS
jgi:serine/threonine protein kinase